MNLWMYVLPDILSKPHPYRRFSCRKLYFSGHFRRPSSLSLPRCSSLPFFHRSPAVSKWSSLSNSSPRKNPPYYQQFRRQFLRQWCPNHSSRPLSNSAVSVHGIGNVLDYDAFGDDSSSPEGQNLSPENKLGEILSSPMVSASVRATLGVLFNLLCLVALFMIMEDDPVLQYCFYAYLLRLFELLGFRLAGLNRRQVRA